MAVMVHEECSLDLGAVELSDALVCESDHDWTTED